jgi:hypothetical protein
MKNEIKDTFFDKVEQGLKISYKKLVEKYRKNDDALILSQNGKIVHVKAKDIKL